MSIMNITEVKGVLDLNPSLVSIPPELISKFSTLIMLLKAAGFIFIMYILFLIIRGIFGIIRGRKIDKIYNKINEIDEKLNLLTKKYKLNVNENNSLKLYKIKPKTKK